MSDEPTNIILERLNRLEKNVLGEVQLVKESIRRIDAKTASTNSYLAGLHSSVSYVEEELASQRGRLEALEDRPTSPDA